MKRQVSVKVWGDYACFARPERKPYHESYDVMTPSAARNILQAIFWKPEIQYIVREIHVLAESKPMMNVTRNSLKNITRCDITNTRDLKHTRILRDVAYAIYADMVTTSPDVDIIKYKEPFDRRVRKGQYGRNMPYLGQREFAAFFAPVAEDDTPIAWSATLGTMFYDRLYTYNRSNPHDTHFFRDGNVIPRDERKGRPDVGKALFFDAVVEHGVLVVPNRRETFEKVYQH